MEKVNKTEVSRREFLKKTAYVAPVVVTLGALSTPVYAKDTSIIVNGQSIGGVPEEDPIGQFFK